MDRVLTNGVGPSKIEYATAQWSYKIKKEIKKHNPLLLYRIIRSYKINTVCRSDHANSYIPKKDQFMHTSEKLHEKLH